MIGNKYNLGHKHSIDVKNICRNAALKQWTNEEHRKSVSEKNRIAKISKMKSVSINGVSYESIMDASRKLNILSGAISNNCKNINKKEWFYINGDV